MSSPSQSLRVGSSICLLLLIAPTFSLGQGGSPEAAMQEALAALQAGQTAQARALLEEMVATWPRHRLANFHLGRLAFDRGELDKADEHLEVATSGEFPRVFLAWYYLGRVRILQRDFDGALEALDKSLDRAPDFGVALMERARARLFKGDIEAGLEQLQDTIANSHGPRQASLLAAQLLIYQGRAEEARPLLKSLSDLSTEDDRWAREARWLLLALDRGPDVQLALGRAVGEHPESGNLYWALAVAHRRDEHGRPAALHRVALDHDSENPVTLLALERPAAGAEAVTQPAAMPNLQSALSRAQRLWTAGKYDEAIEIARRLLEVRPRLVPALLLLARDAERREELWPALAIYETLLDGLGGIPSIGLNLARVAQTMGASDLAACATQWARLANPDDGSLYYLIGVIEADRGATDAAIEAHKKSLELGDDDVRPWLRLGELYFSQMNISESIAAYGQAMAKDPAAAEVVRAFAVSSLTTEQYASLRQLLEKHIGEHPENLNTLYSLGVMNLRDDRLEEAKHYFLRLAELAPDHRQVHYNLGQIYLRQGDSVSGQAEMERFREIKAAEDREWERHNQAHFRRVEARKAVAEGRPEEAVPLYVQSVEEETAEFSDYLELAAAYREVDRAQEAAKVYEQVLSSDPYNQAALQGILETSTTLGDDRREEDATRKLELLNWPCMMTTIDNGGDS